MDSFSGLEIVDLLEKIPVLLAGKWRDSIRSIAFAILAVAVLALLTIESLGVWGRFFRKRVSIFIWSERFNVSSDKRYRFFIQGSGIGLHQMARSVVDMKSALVTSKLSKLVGYIPARESCN